MIHKMVILNKPGAYRNMLVMLLMMEGKKRLAFDCTSANVKSQFPLFVFADVIPGADSII